MLLAYLAGVGPETDAYFSAFIIPDLLNYLLAGGALSIAFLPLYARALENEGEAGATRLLRTTLGNLGLVVIVATVALWIGADRLVALQFPDFDEPTRALTTEITRIVLPAQIFFVLGGVLKATLFARGRFGAAALAPLIYNLLIIVGGLLLYERMGIHGFAWGVLAGAILGPFLAPFIDSLRDGPPGVRVSLLDPKFRQYLWIAAPLMFGQSLLTVDEWFDKWFGALVGTGSVAWLSFARKLMSVPVAVVGQALATAALPTLARLWEAGQHDDLGKTVTRTLRAGGGLALLAAGWLYAVATPLVQFVYGRGEWTSGDTTMVSSVLGILALAVPGWILQQIAVRPFYARGDTWRPMLLGTALVGLAVPLYYGLAKTHGIVGLAWAGVIAMSVNALCTLLLARRLHSAPAMMSLGVSLMRSGVIGALATAATTMLSARLGPQGDGGVEALLRLALLSGVYAVVCAGLVPWVGDRDLRGAIASRLRRFKRRG